MRTSQPAAGWSATPSEQGTAPLERRIHDRIVARLGGRVRRLVVRRSAGTVRLEGECSTYYTKQLAQHAALGVIEDEALENDIVVRLGG